MAARDELPASVRSLLAERAAEDVDELIRTAQAEARAAVARRLREELERELVRAVEERLAPRPPVSAPPVEGDADGAAGRGLWVYCVAREELAQDVAGVVGGEPPHAIHAAGIVALVSAVPLAEFGEHALKRNLNDLDWLGAVARAHEKVLEAALAGGAIVPMRICTIFRGEDQVRRMLTDGRAAFAEALERLTGRAEWGVKVIADRARVAETVRMRGGPASSRSGGERAGEGVAYLGRRQDDRYARELVDVILDEAARESHARLEEWAAASELLPAQRPELGGFDGEMVFNGAYLVDDDRVEAFEAVVTELTRQYADAGLSFELSGPWPAFHFVNDAPSTEAPVS